MRSRAPSPGRARRLAAAALAVAGAVASGCARPGAPPGGEEDRRPPSVRSTRPDSGAVVEAFRESVRIAFDERISERPTSGRLGDAVVVSPRTSEASVDHARDALEVELVGGFREGLVYTVTVLPVVQDMFRNALAAPYTLVFSTGPAIPATLLAGVVTNRITGDAVPGAVVDARVVGDSVTYTARPDEAGVFTLPHVPPGTYRVVAYQDRNRDRVVDPFEPRDTARASVEPADTGLAALRILPPDTTPPVLARADVEDSVTVRLTFDDHLPERGPLEPLRVRVRREGVPDTVSTDTLPGAELPVDTVLRPRAYEAWAAERRRARAEAGDTAAGAAADTAAADTAGAAPPGAPADTGVVRPDTAGAGEAGAEPPVRPSQELYVALLRILRPAVRYEVTVEGVRNVQGVPGGGGSVVFEGPVPPPPDTTAADSASAPDSAAPDSAAAPPDSLEASPPDTASADTSSVDDTSSAHPEPGRRSGAAPGAGLRRLRRLRLRDLFRVRSRTGAGRPPPWSGSPGGG